MSNLYVYLKKMNEYATLHSQLGKRVSKHNSKVADAENAYSSYKGTVPNLSHSKIPSNDFEPKREEKGEELNVHFDYEKSKTSDLVAAQNKAHERHLHYKKLYELELKKLKS